MLWSFERRDRFEQGYEKTITSLIVAAGFWSAGVFAEDLKLSLPIKCHIGETCFIQQYMDVDPGSKAQDYRCGNAVYNKHSGTDIRLRTLEDARRGVEVLAAAPGKVLRTRDAAPDRIVATQSDRDAFQNVFCGNGLIIDHGDGWQTQYCHLRRGSLRVKAGDMVERGTPLGLVGYSGLAQFPHLHLTVYRDKIRTDPLTGSAADGGLQFGLIRRFAGRGNTGSVALPERPNSVLRVCPWARFTRLNHATASRQRIHCFKFAFADCLWLVDQSAKG